LLVDVHGGAIVGAGVMDLRHLVEDLIRPVGPRPRGHDLRERVAGPRVIPPGGPGLADPELRLGREFALREAGEDLLEILAGAGVLLAAEVGLADQEERVVDPLRIGVAREELLRLLDRLVPSFGGGRHEPAAGVLLLLGDPWS